VVAINLHEGKKSKAQNTALSGYARRWRLLGVTLDFLTRRCRVANCDVVWPPKSGV
jgi:hypothetical protein